MNTAKITVIVPIYNAEKYLAACLDSITEQTYKDLEIILVNDGSCDASLSIAEEHARRDSRIKLLTKENGGAASARNCGLDIAEGDYIGFVDADDIIEPDMLEYLYTKAKEHSADIVQCATYVDASDKSCVIYAPRRDLFIDIAKSGGGTLRKHLFFGCCAKLYKRSAIRGIRFNESTVIGEDLRFNLDALAAVGHIAVCPEPKYHYIQRANSITHGTPERALTSFRDMLHKAAQDFNALPALVGFIKDTGLHNNTDICSKIVLGGLTSYSELFGEIRKEIRRSTLHIIFRAKIPRRDKAKLLLIAYLPGLYKRTLTKAKLPKNAKEAV